MDHPTPGVVGGSDHQVSLYKSGSLQLKSYLIIRDEVIWIHDELFKFFKALKDLKQQRPKGEKQQAGKKAKEAEALFMKALQLAPAFHRGRRIYLAGLLEQQVSLPFTEN